MAATLTTAELNSLAVKFDVDGSHAALFTADPGLTGTVVGEVTGGSPAYARVPITWSGPAGGVITATAVFDVPNGITLTFAGVCTASTGNTLIARAAITSTPIVGQATYTLTLTFTETSV